MRPHVMIVDDSTDQLNFMLMVFRLVDPNLIVVAKESGDEALALLQHEPESRPKVLLLDIRMPGRGGLDVLREMKAHQHLRRIPVCTFSNGDVGKEICAAYEAGASIYFVKPTGLEETKRFVDAFKRIWFDHASFCVH